MPIPSQRIAVIGGVAAGPAAAAQAVRSDPKAEVHLFEQGPVISYGACEIPYYVSGQIERVETLVQFDPERFQNQRGARVHVSTMVKEIHPSRNRLVAEGPGQRASEERFDKFIIATGAKPRRLNIDGEESTNVFSVRSLNDAVDIKNFLAAHRVRHALVVGGGYIGAEMAEALVHRQIRVTILDPVGGVLHRYVSGPLQDIVQEHLQKAGVQIRRERAVRFDFDAANHVSAVTTDRGERIGCQLVIVAIGTEPNTCLAKEAGIRLRANGAVDVDDQMRSSLPNVWACGDTVEVRRVVDGKQIYLPLSPTAFRTAHVAGENAARRGRGAPATFAGVVGASTVKVFGLEVARVGIPLEDASDSGFDAFAERVHSWSRVSFYPGARRLHVELVVERSRGRLIGGTVVGEEGAAMRANVLVPLIWREWRVRDIRDLDLVYAPPVAPSIDPLLTAAHRAAQRL